MIYARRTNRFLCVGPFRKRGVIGAYATPTLTHHANVLSAGFNQRCLGVAATTPD